MAKKLKTSLKFEFDTEDLDETIPDLNYEIKLKTKVSKTNINIVDIKKKKKRVLDASTKLF